MLYNKVKTDGLYSFFFFVHVANTGCDGTPVGGFAGKPHYRFLHGKPI